MLSMQLICMPPLLLAIVAIVLPKRLDVSLFSKLYLSKLKTVVEQVQPESHMVLLVLGSGCCCTAVFDLIDDVFLLVAASDDECQVQDAEDDARVRQGRPYCGLCSHKHASGFTAKALSTVLFSVAASVPDVNGQNQVLSFRGSDLRCSVA
jgi:hypothetical protein